MLLQISSISATAISYPPVSSSLDIRFQRELKLLPRYNVTAFLNGTATDIHGDNSSVSFAHNLNLENTYGGNKSTNTSYYKLIVPYFATNVNLYLVNDKSSNICFSNAIPEMGAYTNSLIFQNCTLDKTIPKSHLVSAFNEQINCSKYNVTQMGSLSK